MKPLAPKIESPARSDLRRIGKETAEQWGEAQKARYLSKIETLIKTIALQPRMGQARDDLRGGVRTVVAGKHHILYSLRDGRVHILRVVHQSRDLQREIERGRSKEMEIGR